MSNIYQCPFLTSFNDFLIKLGSYYTPIQFYHLISKLFLNPLTTLNIKHTFKLTTTFKLNILFIFLTILLYFLFNLFHNFRFYLLWQFRILRRLSLTVIPSVVLFWNDVDSSVLPHFVIRPCYRFHIYLFAFHLLRSHRHPCPAIMILCDLLGNVITLFKKFSSH